MREIKERACIRIGELVRELEKAKTIRTKGGVEVRLLTSEKSKSQAIKEAGLSLPTAYRYEELAGGRDEQAHNAAKAAAELPFA
jgi:hypothetical protein